MTNKIIDNLDLLTTAVYGTPVKESATITENKTNDLTKKKHTKKVKSPEQIKKILQNKKEHYRKKQTSKLALRNELQKLLNGLSEDIIVRDSCTIFFKKKKYAFTYNLRMK